MHGILGQKTNWNNPAKRLLERISPLGWRVLLVDHRGHGQSPVGNPPHNLEACALDLQETLNAAGVDIEKGEVVICGHSFGGKVALMFLRKLLAAGKPVPRMTWLFDSVPSRMAENQGLRSLEEDDQGVEFVLGAVRALKERGTPCADRSALVQALEEQRLRRPIAQWLAQSSRTLPSGGIELSYDLQAVKSLYESYRGTDMFDVLEDGRANVGIIVAGRSQGAWDAATLDRLKQCGPHVQVVHLKEAGHNVHVDDLPGLLDALAPTWN